jgi:hypothetical protein
MVAPPSRETGLTVTKATEFSTADVYVVVLGVNAGDRDPVPKVRLSSWLSVLSDDALVTVTLYVVAMIVSCAVTTT